MIYGTLTLAGVCLIAVSAIRDIAVRAVPNVFAVGILACGVGMRLVDSNLLASLFVAIAVFTFAFLCWHHHWLGGADVKLLTAVSVLVQPELVPSLLAAIALVGGVLSLIYLITRRRLPASSSSRPDGLLHRILRTEHWRLRRGGPLPYAVAIASGVIITVVNGGLL